MTDERRDLAQRISGHLDDLDDATVKELVDGALKAERTVWVTVECKHCGRDGKYEAAVPDAGQKVKALEILLRAREKPAEIPEHLREGWGQGRGVNLADVLELARKHGVDRGQPPAVTLDDVVLYAREHDLVLRPRRDGEGGGGASSEPDPVPATPPTRKGTPTSL